ncbi:hypothetical protein GCM10010978_07400 [Compostibacillus humi]|uniref:Uncharacterized protein n=1 Tax=Compostibacillus humi TaxID=1245525 RepID=A0A8J2ZQ77_9BACI|nr:hypothetical protein [Compostibacillus humi]GGH71449.1 hypothetical protein GCM10010978_07400 [Compostibacillus humi]
MSFEHQEEIKHHKSATVSKCENKPIEPKVSIGKIVTKVPVVLAELKLQIHVHETITFPEPVLEIKETGCANSVPPAPSDK